MNFYLQLTALLNKSGNTRSHEYYHHSLINFTTTGLSIFITKENFMQWVNTPSIDCQGRCPKDLMNRISEIKDLTSILNRISHGIPY